MSLGTNLTKIKSFELNTIGNFGLNASREFFGVDNFTSKIIVVEQEVLLLFRSC
jgi:hypothetical protein